MHIHVLASTQNTGKWQNKWLIDNYKSDIKLAHLFFLSKMSVWTGSTDRVHRESIGWVFIGQNSRCIPTGGTYHILFILPESVSIYPSWHLLLSTCNSSHQMCINNCASLTIGKKFINIKIPFESCISLMFTDLLFIGIRILHY